jgi:hypothetical protein
MTDSQLSRIKALVAECYVVKPGANGLTVFWFGGWRG